MASIVWVQLFVLSNYNIFTQYLKKFSENTVKVIVFFIPILLKFALLSKCNVASRLFLLGYNW